MFVRGGGIGEKIRKFQWAVVANGPLNEKWVIVDKGEKILPLKNDRGRKLNLEIFETVTPLTKIFR